MWFKRKLNPEKIKINNTKELLANGIEVIKHLPHLDLPSFRDPQQIARRAMVLVALLQLHFGAPTDVIHDWIIDNHLEGELTENEKTYLKVKFDDLPEQDQINIYWYIEAIWTFAWVGGLHHNLSLHTEVENSLAEMIPSPIKKISVSAFIENFKIRNEKEIFTTLDKFYRAHWFAKNNSLKGIHSDKVLLDVVIERRKALEYVCYNEGSWDDVDMST